MERDDILSNYLDSIPYELYSFQEEALMSWFASEHGVLCCAPTGMGKTLIAEAAVYEALHTRKRIYYTTPLIALTDQKYREMQKLVEKWGFSREDVGLITGNRRENPDALVRVVVAEILLNHLLARDTDVADMESTGAVVMDEFHNFNDFSRGIVWELSLALLPLHVRVMLLSATVGNPREFAGWLKKEFGRKLDVVTSNERRVPLEFVWVEDKLLPEHLTDMVSSDDEENRTPALVFAFNRDECWQVAEKLKGLPIVSNARKKEIETALERYDGALSEGVGPKLRQMLLRGIGVHHAGVLPRHKEIVEDLFSQKLTPFVVCTETLAAGINLPARSVVLVTLLKGKRGEKKLIPPSAAHQMFGRAGRPQFDTKGYVFSVAHDDDVKINKWRKRYDQIDPNSKDPGIMRMRKELERKKPSRRKTEQYWGEGQFKQLIEAGSAKLYSRSMISYQVLIYLLTKYGTLHEVREFVSKRFNGEARIEKFQEQLDFMLSNMAGLGYLTRAEDGDHITLDASIEKLLNFRSVDPLYGAFLAGQLVYSNWEEKILALESVLEVPRVIERHVRIPAQLPKGAASGRSARAADDSDGRDACAAGRGGRGGAGVRSVGDRRRRRSAANVPGDAEDRVRGPARSTGAGVGAVEAHRRGVLRDGLRVLRVRQVGQLDQAGGADPAAPAAAGDSGGRIPRALAGSGLRAHCRVGNADVPTRGQAVHRSLPVGGHGDAQGRVGVGITYSGDRPRTRWSACHARGRRRRGHAGPGMLR